MNNKTYENRAEDSKFLNNALTFHGSVTPLVIRKVIFFFIYAVIISIVDHCYADISLPIGPFEYAGLILGLILVFRINNGYDRWWEGRKLWGTIVNSSRNFAIIVQNYLGAHNSKRAILLNHYAMALPFLIKNRLRDEKSIAEVSDILDPQARAILEKNDNKPIMLASMMAHQLSLAKEKQELDSFPFLKAEEQRAILVDALGACERIRNTPIPFVMAIKSRRFILIFLIMLPLAVVNISTIVSPFISGLVAYAILSIDQIGLELQNPFSISNLSHLPLDQICKKIRNDIVEINNENHL